MFVRLLLFPFWFGCPLIITTQYFPSFKKELEKHTNTYLSNIPVYSEHSHYREKKINNIEIIFIAHDFLYKQSPLRIENDCQGQL